MNSNRGPLIPPHHPLLVNKRGSHGWKLTWGSNRFAIHVVVRQIDRGSPQARLRRPYRLPTTRAKTPRRFTVGGGLLKSIAEYALLDMLATLLLVVANYDRQVFLGTAQLVEPGQLRGH